ncbi:MAG: DUF3179 domain-containing (seleno)protein [Gemmatales bacterium]
MYVRLALLVALLPLTAYADEPCCPKTIVAAERFPTLVNPNCSHCVDEARRRGSELTPSDNVLCWIRGYSEGGAIPYRFFLNAYPVISDSYGSFVSDPYAGFARAYGPWYHYRFHGWHGGVMLIKDTKDGTIYSALSGKAIDGPKKGTKLAPIPSVVSQWSEWLEQYPNAVAYHLYPKYQPVEALPIDEAQAKASRGKVDERLPENTRVLGVTIGDMNKAYLESEISSRKFLTDTLAGTTIVILWQPSTKTAAAYVPYASPPRKFVAPKPNADGISPAQPEQKGLPNDRPVTLRYQPSNEFPNAPYVDADTNSHWDVTGRAVDGKYKSWTLAWIDSVQVKWFAWSMEYPTTQIYGKEGKTAEAPAAPLNDKVKAIAGTAEFLKSVPKVEVIFNSYHASSRTVSFFPVQADAGHATSLTLSSAANARLTPDAEVKRHGWWARPEQFEPNEKVWVWYKTDRHGNRVAISMMMDELSRQEMQGGGLTVTSKENDRITLEGLKSKMVVAANIQLMRGPQFQLHSDIRKNDKLYLSTRHDSYLYDQEAFDTLKTRQKQWLRNQWSSHGLPGTVTFTHVFNGELDVVLDHEAMRWARSLQPGTSIQLLPPQTGTPQPPIQGIVKFVQPQRERTLARLVVNGKDQADLNIGDRLHLKMPVPPASVDDSPYPSDIDQPRATRDERIEWFLASIYCTCGVDKDTCTGHVYTLSCCNPNGCGMPNDMRKQLGTMIDQGLDNRAIFDALLKKHGPLLVKPHLKP